MLYVFSKTEIKLFWQCTSRGMVTGFQSQGIGSRRESLMPWESRLEGSTTKECLWILNSSVLVDRASQPRYVLFSKVSITVWDKSQQNMLRIYFTYKL